jgi:uncharacterized protein (DUF302 family)
MLVFVCAVAAGATANAQEGLVSVQSANSVPETITRLQGELERAGARLLREVEDPSTAGRDPVALSPRELITFVFPDTSERLIRCSRTVVLDVPHRVAIWEDKTGKAWITYRNPDQLAETHDLAACRDAVDATSRQLLNVTAFAARSPQRTSGGAR